RRRRDVQQGFTLIELMVVVLIIAILIAIAIPTFLGARKRAQDRAVQSELRNALVNEKVSYTDSSTYEANAANMKLLEPALDWPRPRDGGYRASGSVSLRCLGCSVDAVARKRNSCSVLH